MQSVLATIKRAFWAIFLCFALISFPLPSLAVTVQDVPNPRQVYGGWVTDMANLFDSETKATLNQIISKLEAENGTEIAVVTVPDTAPADSPKQFATQLFNYWGIGKTNINNGVLFLISKDEHRVEIDTGYGIEKILPNAQVSHIIDQLIIPHFKQGDFTGGTLAGIEVLTNALARHDMLATTSVISSKYLSGNQAYIGFFVIIGLILIGLLCLDKIIQAGNGDSDQKYPRRSGSLSSGSSSASNRNSNEKYRRKSGSLSTGTRSRRSGSGSSSGDSSVFDSSWSGGDSGGFGGGDSGGGGDGGSW
jgi:uncharacterized protein